MTYNHLKCLHYTTFSVQVELSFLSSRYPLVIFVHHVVPPSICSTRSYPKPSSGPLLESPGNLTGPKSYIEIKFSRKVGSVLTSNKVHFVSLANKTFENPVCNGKQNGLTRPVITGSFEKRAPGLRLCYRRLLL